VTLFQNAIELANIKGKHIHRNKSNVYFFA